MIVDDHRPLLSQVVIIGIRDVHGICACAASGDDLMVVGVVIVAWLVGGTAGSAAGSEVWHRCCGGGECSQPCWYR